MVKARPDAIVVNEGANTLDFARSIVDMYEPRKRLDVGTWGIMGIGMGFAVAAAVVTGKPVIAIEGDSAFGFSGMEVETICRYNLPVCVVVFNNNGIYKGTDVNPRGGDVAPTVFVKGARYDMMMQAFGGVGVHRQHAGRTEQGDGRGGRQSGKPTLINAIIDETAGTESGRITSLNPAERGEEEVISSQSTRRTHMSNKPLEGIKIIDFTHVQAGPACTQMLAWFGADVIKVERPGSGDVTRSQLRDIPDVDALYFTMLNSNKRSLTLDTKKPRRQGSAGEADQGIRRDGRELRPRRARPHGLHLGAHPGTQPEDDPGLGQGLLRRPPLRRPEGLRERRAVRRRRGLDHRLVGRPADRSAPPRWATATPACTWPSAS